MGYVSFGWTGEVRNIKVELDEQEGVWYTVHSDGEGNDDPIMTRIFGTNRLPSPWNGETDKGHRRQRAFRTQPARDGRVGTQDAS